MSVYTQLARADFERFLSFYDEGSLLHWKGIEAGIENTNYFVDTLHPEKGKQHFVLTLFETVPAERLPFFLRFMEHLANSGLPVPAPIHGRDDQPLRQLFGKPCMLQPRLRGEHIAPEQITIEQCRMIGENLAHIHIAGQTATCTQDNLRGMAWIGQQITRLSSLLPESEARLQSEQWHIITTALAQEPELPRGLIHADLFVDNVLFEGGALSGIIDFFQSCEDWLLYDVAVTVNDWCLKDDGLSLDHKCMDALLSAYDSIRPFTHAERRVWPVMQQLACLRFWISRLITYTHPEHQQTTGEDALRHFKDPDQFRDRLLLRMELKQSTLLEANQDSSCACRNRDF